MLQCGPLARISSSRKNWSSKMAPIEEDDDFIGEIIRPSKKKGSKTRAPTNAVLVLQSEASRTSKASKVKLVQPSTSSKTSTCKVVRPPLIPCVDGTSNERNQLDLAKMETNQLNEMLDENNDDDNLPVECVSEKNYGNFRKINYSVADRITVHLNVIKKVLAETEKILIKKKFVTSFTPIGCLGKGAEWIRLTKFNKDLMHVENRNIFPQVNDETKAIVQKMSVACAMDEYARKMTIAKNIETNRLIIAKHRDEICQLDSNLMIPLNKLVDHEITKTTHETAKNFRKEGSMKQCDKYFCQYCDGVVMFDELNQLAYHYKRLHTTEFGKAMMKYYAKADSLTDDEIRSVLQLMTPNLFGEEEFVVFLKEEHMEKFAELMNAKNDESIVPILPQVQSQNFASNVESFEDIEIIEIDDSSTDGSTEPLSQLFISPNLEDNAESMELFDIIEIDDSSTDGSIEPHVSLEPSSNFANNVEFIGGIVEAGCFKIHEWDFLVDDNNIEEKWWSIVDMEENSLFGQLKRSRDWDFEKVSQDECVLRKVPSPKKRAKMEIDNMEEMGCPLSVSQLLDMWCYSASPDKPV